MQKQHKKVTLPAALAVIALSLALAAAERCGDSAPPAPELANAPVGAGRGAPTASSPEGQIKLRAPGGSGQALEEPAGAPPGAGPAVPSTRAPVQPSRPEVAPVPGPAQPGSGRREDVRPSGVDPKSGLAWVAREALPREARDTLADIARGGPYDFDRDGITFQNREGILPRQARGYYLEFTVKTPGVRSRGARRIVTGRGGEQFYSDDHYASFQRIAP